MSPTKLILLSLIGYCIGTTPLQTPDGNVISGNGRMVFSDEEYDRSRVTAPEQLPTVKLPYGTYRANSYDSSRDVYVFTNIRFAKPPTGPLRFAKPVTPPDTMSGIQNGTVGNACNMIIPKYGLNFFGDLAFDNFTAPILNGIIGNIGSLVANGAEDCLFLDVYVPGAFFKNRNRKKVAVANWITGGAVILGSKEMFGLYSGSHLVEMGKGDMIFVAANYRLGVYGWLAGPTLENDPTATPNAGLYDQRAVLEWIQNYIHLFGGDKDKVTVIGESAGASSIEYHLTAFDGKQKPLFNRAVALSPAFQPLGDRRPKGMMQEIYSKFEKWNGCAGKGISCLRDVPMAQMDKYNQQLQDEAPRGSFAVGISSDGKWARTLAGTELLRKQVVPIESLIISHTAAESVIFVDGSIANDKQFDEFIVGLFGPIAKEIGFVDAIKDVYPPVGDGKGLYKNETARVRDFIRDAAFACNSRYISQAYPANKQWYMVFNELGGWHGMDLIALFLRVNMNVGGKVIPLTPGIGAMSRTYQSLLVSYVITGDPNTRSIKEKSASTVPAIRWPKGPRMVGQDIANAMFVENGTFRMGVDKFVPKKNCDFLQSYMDKLEKQYLS